MRNTIIKYTFLCTLITILTGCFAPPPYPSPAAVEIPIKQTELKAVPIELKKGVIVYNSGNKFFDENGNIIKIFYIKDRLFYLLDDGELKLKDENKQTIKNFQHKYLLWKELDDHIIISTSSSSQNINKHIEDVYKFDGKNLKLINKNFELFRDIGKIYNIAINDANYIVYSDSVKGNITEEYYIHDYIIDDVSNGNRAEFLDFKPNADKKYHPSERTYILGIAADNVIYAYSPEIGGDVSIGGYNMKTKSNQVFYTGKRFNGDKFQILKNGKNVVIKILPQNIPLEEGDKTRYTNTPGKLIHLNTLNEIKSIDRYFIPIVVQDGYINKKWVTYDLSTLMDSVVKKKNKTVF